MRYEYTAPRAEKHEVTWDLHTRHGLFDGKRKTFGSLTFSPEMREWLDANCPGWSFRSDWDYSNAGDDDEGCHLTVRSPEQADAFIAHADAVSALAKADIDRAIALDRETMPLRARLTTNGGKGVEIARGHTTDGLQDEIMAHLYYTTTAKTRIAIRRLTSGMTDEQDQATLVLDNDRGDPALRVIHIERHRL